MRSLLRFSKNGYIPPHGQDPFATHLPILAAIGRLFKIERVLELGCGQYSTLTFLQPKVFPYLKVLHSYESDSLWVEKIASMVKDDPRVKVVCIENSLESFVNTIQFERYDLVFIDNSMIYEERAKTIKAVVEKYSPNNLLVVHDFEAEIYQQAMCAVPNQFVFEALIPNTGMGWKDLSFDTIKLKEVNTLIKENSMKIHVDDLDGWIKKLDELIANGNVKEMT